MIWNLIGSIGGKVLDISDDVVEDKDIQAEFWKQHYNTPLGKGAVTKYVYKVQKVLKGD